MALTYPVSISLLDKSESTSTTSINANETQISDHLTDPSSGSIFNWFAAVANLSLSEVVSQQAAINESNVVAAPTDDDAYNSAKLTVFYHDATTDRKYRHTVPARDKAAYNTYPKSKNVILTIAAGGTAQIEALVSAVNGLYTPDGHLAVVDNIVISGGRQG